MFRVLTYLKIIKLHYASASPSQRFTSALKWYLKGSHSKVDGVPSDFNDLQPDLKFREKEFLLPYHAESQNGAHL